MSHYNWQMLNTLFWMNFTEQQLHQYKCRKKVSYYTFNKSCSCESLTHANLSTNYHCCRPPHYSCTLSYCSQQSSTGRWLAGQIKVTGSGYKHAQRRAVTSHAQAAICPCSPIQRQVRCCLHVRLYLLSDALPSVCSRSAAFPGLLQPRTQHGVFFSRAFWCSGQALVHL